MRKVYFVARYTEGYYKDWLGRRRHRLQLACLSVVVDGRTIYNAYCSEFSSRYTDPSKDKVVLDELLVQPHECRKTLKDIARDVYIFLYEQQLFGSDVVVVTSGDPMQAWYLKELWELAGNWHANEHLIHSVHQTLDTVADMIPEGAFGPSSDFCTYLLPPYNLDAKRIMLHSHVDMPDVQAVPATALMAAMQLRSLDHALTKIRNEFTKQIVIDETDSSQQQEEAESNTVA